MPLQVHDMEIADGSTLQNLDRVVIAQQFNIPNGSGGTAGNPVTVSVSFAFQSLPANYAVIVQPNQACLSYVTAKGFTSFNVVLTPSPATATLQAGSFDAIVIG